MRVSAAELSKSFKPDEIAGMLDDLNRLQQRPLGKLLQTYCKRELKSLFVQQNDEVSDQNLNAALKTAGSIDCLQKFFNDDTQEMFPGLADACATAVKQFQG